VSDAPPEEWFSEIEKRHAFFEYHAKAA